MLSSWVVLGHQHQMGTRVWLLCSSAQYSLSTPQGWGNLKKPCCWYLQHKKTCGNWNRISLFFQWSRSFSVVSVMSILASAPTFSFIISSLRCDVRRFHPTRNLTWLLNLPVYSYILLLLLALGPLVWLIWTSWPQIMVKASSFKHKNDRKKGCFHLHSLLTLRFCSFCSLFCKRQSIL